MKVMFLTSSPGYGHKRAAEAVEAALRQRFRSVQAHSLDLWDTIDPQVRAAGHDGYLRLTAEYPRLYQKLYDLDQKIYDQLAGRVPPDQELVDFLTGHRERWCPESNQGFVSWNRYRSLDSALINTVISGICARRANATDRLVLSGALTLIYRILARRLKDAVKEYGPDLIVATQMHPNALLSSAVQRGQIRQPIIGVITDYGLQSVWVRNNRTHYCVGDEQVAVSLASRGVPRSRISVTGIPLMPEFARPPSQQDARRQLGLENAPTLLITGGRHGIGTVDAVQNLVSQSGPAYQILVTAGPATEGYERLNALAKRYPRRLRLLGWTDDMTPLLSAADVVAGKPGGLSITEALACGRPFFATCSLGGQEAHNVQYLERLGLGWRIQPEELAARAHAMLSDPARLKGLQSRARQQLRQRGATGVGDVIESIMRDARSGSAREMS